MPVRKAVQKPSPDEPETTAVPPPRHPQDNPAQPPEPKVGDPSKLDPEKLFRQVLDFGPEHYRKARRYTVRVNPLLWLLTRASIGDTCADANTSRDDLSMAIGKIILEAYQREDVDFFDALEAFAHTNFRPRDAAPKHLGKFLIARYCFYFRLLWELELDLERVEKIADGCDDGEEFVETYYRSMPPGLQHIGELLKQLTPLDHGQDQLPELIAARDFYATGGCLQEFQIRQMVRELCRQPKAEEKPPPDSSIINWIKEMKIPAKKSRKGHPTIARAEKEGRHSKLIPERLKRSKTFPAPIKP